MRDFQWVVSDFLLRHLKGELIWTLAVLLAVLALTAVFVGLELRKERDDGNADQ